MEDRVDGRRQTADGSQQEAGGSGRLALLGLAFLGVAVLCDAAWFTRSVGEKGGMAFGVRRLGLRLDLSQAQFDALAIAMAVAGLAGVAIAFPAARRALATCHSPLAALPWLAAALLFVAVSLPWHHVIGRAVEGLRPEAELNSAWARVRLSRELALTAAPRLFWLAALVALGAWAMRLPRCGLCDAMARAVGRLRALPLVGGASVPRAGRRRLACVVAAALTLTVLAVAFIRGVHGGKPCFPDASVYYYQAKTFAAGRVASPLVGGKGFFDAAQVSHLHLAHSGHVRNEDVTPVAGSFVVAGDRWFSVGLPGAPALFAVGLLLGLPWLVPPLLGGAVVIATYFLAKEVFGEEAGVLALPLAALSPWLIFLSGEYLTHVPCMLATTLFLTAALRCLRQPTWRAGAAAGLMLGASVLIRPVTAAALALPVAVAWLVWLVRRPAAAWRPTLALLLALAVPLAGLLLYNQATTGRPFTLGYQLAASGTGVPPVDSTGKMPVPPIAEGWRWTPALGLANLLETLYLGSMATFQWPIPLFGVLLVSLVFLGLGDVPERRWSVLIVLLSALSLALAHVRWGNVAGWMGGPRYFAEATPLVVALTAGVLVLLARRLAGATGVLGVILAFLFLHAGFRVAMGPEWRVERAESQARRGTIAAIRAQVKPPAIVFLPLGEGHSAVSDFYAALAENDPALIKGIIFARDLGERNRDLAAARPDHKAYRWHVDPDSRKGVAIPLPEPRGAETPRPQRGAETPRPQ
ncbi:MAG: glycosyltransferase family 39 protein [Planctomycetes bacterium]|nr:glycosyltransferase family 39 protein [Planctomycetota bacterium]